MDLAVKKKVLFVIDTLQTGGAEQSLLENTTRLKTIQPVVCHLYTGELLKPRFIESGITVYSVGIQKKYDFSNAISKLKEIVLEEKPDLMVAYLTRSEIVTRRVGKSLGIPVIGTFVSDLYSKTYNAGLSFKAKLAVSFFKFLNKQTGRYCKGFIANSNAIKESNALQLGVPLSKIEVINRGRDSKIFKFHSPKVMPGKPIHFLNIGRLVPVKGQRDLVNAFAKFNSNYPDTHLDIIGEGPARADLTSLINELGLQEKVKLLGSRSDIPAIIHNYDCFVFPSYSEGFSGSVIESMLSGIPVLASDIPVNKEAVAHMKTGYLFEKGNVEGIYEAMKWFHDNREKASHLAGNAYLYAIDNFEQEKIVSKLENYFLKHIDKK
jgi:glycosyltransferase involved in cell wall biosynthesis